MKKNTDKIILILEELISHCKERDKKSMMDVYSSIKEDLKEKKVSPDEAKKLCNYFCGYQAHADLTDYEYVRVKKIINFFWS